jgi:exopolysaccharide biosynthesis polyprenyl glycosylphosphotransferase
MSLSDAAAVPILELRARASNYRRYAPVLVLGVDVLTVYAAFVVAYVLRYHYKLGGHVKSDIAFGQYQPVAFMLICILIPVLLLKGAYRYRLSKDVADDFTTVFSAATISIAAVVIIAYFSGHFLYSRGVIAYLWVALIVFVFLGRLGYRSLQAVFHRRGWGVRRLLVIGATDVGKMVMQSVMSRPDLGYQLVGFVDHRAVTRLQDFGRFRAIGQLSDVPDLITSGAVDDVVIALPAASHEDTWPIVSLCEQHGVGLKIVPDLFEMSLSRVAIDDIAGIPLLDVQERTLKRVASAAKRAVDLAVGCLALLLASPLIAALAVWIKLESQGPALLRQTRVGESGKTFTCLKLRSMWVDAENYESSLALMNEADGHIFKIRSDPRCTPSGRSMRRLSLDELPQLWNVVKGEMSLVGPRPALPTQVARYDDTQRRRLEVKPGMTGIWQVNGRSDLSFDEMVLMDIFYVENWSLTLDMKILARTLVAVIRRHGAY